MGVTFKHLVDMGYNGIERTSGDESGTYYDAYRDGILHEFKTKTCEFTGNLELWWKMGEDWVYQYDLMEGGLKLA